MKNAFRRLLCVLFGAIAGTVLGILATWTIVKVCVALSPKDPSAASAGDVGMLVIPGGFFCGASIGATRGGKKTG